ncbi:hypothetical protein BJ138DRAFT_1141110 [Hygrophoropsis aurantiaca]|uniref:Uncharacterized protein n=1 Tax=Hygrophoropsis aurantiaca TaxID=72124 RepID=A0ACB8AQZ9_9AGAM|nr:hypothetical protein BJ138DRAFT_1141110 [Hygrophoropsis aurantiaca]
MARSRGRSMTPMPRGLGGRSVNRHPSCLPSPSKEDIRVLGSERTRITLLHGNLRITANRFNPFKNQVKDVILQYMDISKRFDELTEDEWLKLKTRALRQPSIRDLCDHYENAWILEVAARRIYCRFSQLQHEKALFCRCINEKISDPHASGGRAGLHVLSLKHMSPRLTAFLERHGLLHALPGLIVGGLDSDKHFRQFKRAPQDKRHEFLKNAFRGSTSCSSYDKLRLQNLTDELAGKAQGC